MTTPVPSKVSDAAAADQPPPSVHAAKTDPTAFGPLYRQHYLPIVGYLYRRTGERHTAEDLAADVFLAAFRSLPRFRGGDVEFRHWLFRIATNAAHRWARRRGRLKLIPAEAAEPSHSPRDPAADREEAQAALLALAPGHQAVLSLHYLEGMPLDEIALVLKCPSGTVKSRLSRARQALKQELERRRRTTRA